MVLASAPSRHVRVQRRAADDRLLPRRARLLARRRRRSTSTTRTATTSTSATRSASPGSLITFFEWPRADRGRLGRGTLESIGLVTPVVSAETEARGSRRPAAAALPGRAARAARRRRDRQSRSLRGARRRERADLRSRRRSRRSALIGAGITHHVAWRAADDAEQAAVARAARRARPAADGAAGPQVLPLDLLPHARRDPARDRDRRPRASSSTSRRGGSATRSRCRRGSSPSARRSSASSRRSAERRLDCRPPTRWWRNW